MRLTIFCNVRVGNILEMYYVLTIRFVSYKLEKDRSRSDFTNVIPGTSLANGFEITLQGLIKKFGL
jgi:hypothetical protein